MLRIERKIIPADERILNCKCGKLAVIKWITVAYLFGKRLPDELNVPDVVIPRCLSCDRKDVEDINKTHYPHYIDKKLRHFIEHNI